MKPNFTFLYFLLGASLISLGANAQTAGDFRTNGTGGGNWSALATWQTFNGAAWVAAAATPTSADGVIEIQNGDNVLEDVAGLTVDQVLIDAGGTLTANQGGTPVLTLNLADGPGDDLVVNGTFALGGGYTLAGSGNADVMVASGGVTNFTSGFLQAVTVVASGGIFNVVGDFDGAGFPKHLGAKFTNNGVFNWGTGAPVSGLFFDGSTFTNNGTINENFTTNHGLTDEAGSNSFINNGIFNKNSSNGFFNQSLPFTNNGTFNGQGFVQIDGVSNIVSGIFVPGAINGATTNTFGMNMNAITNQTPNLKAYIGSPGGAVGTNYDQITITDAGVVDLSLATLTVLDIGSGTDAVNTTYTILNNTGGGTFSGTFANVVLSPNLGNLTINASTVTVQKTSAQILPLDWGPFTAIAQGNSVLLNWSTYEEQNTSHFNVQYSADGGRFTTIGTVAAAGNSSKPSLYSFTHNKPALNGTNYYRIQEVDLDGKGGTSTVQAVRFSNGQIVKVQATPSPVHDLLQLNVQETGLSAVLVDGSGRALRTWILQPGTQQVNVSTLPAGLYQLVIYQHKQQIDIQHILKF
ncbi:MAG: hypothetical protein Q8927_03055 [Bacteroidota bacterium]|nr:hypothetical protein [Bacteroidota bacterium]MDP4215152.1 hypothetical protein [Bacteroidota bacterium]MDP4246747.1 hypothetical protein [Bacteroidota bacterium]MDP4255022.1 hypothetical protein [Bacteroidota bacterium]MDP4258720.1 hypothetical protein [Bacteroidota bacterium]